MNLSFRARGSEDAQTVDVAQILAVPWLDCEPMREPTVHRNTRCKPGYQYVNSVAALVSYESLIEAQFLMVADWRGLAWVLPQPMMITFESGSTPARHIPDFLLCDSDGVLRLVDVCSPRALTSANREQCHAATAAFCTKVGWTYEVFTGLETALAKNLRLLTHHASPHPLAVPLLEYAFELAADLGEVRLGELIASAAAECGALVTLARAAVFSLLWSRRLLVDLTVPLSDDSSVRPGQNAWNVLGVAA